MSDRKSSCSFCGKPDGETHGLVAVPARHGKGRICGECLDLCRENTDPARRLKHNEGTRPVYRIKPAGDSKPALACSFCGARMGRGAKRLALGPKTTLKFAICEPCVEKAGMVLSNQLESRLWVKLLRLIADNLHLRSSGIRRLS